MGELPGEASLVGDVFSCRQLVQVLQTRNAQRALAVMSTKIRNTKTQHKDIQNWSWHWSIQNTMKGTSGPD